MMNFGNLFFFNLWSHWVTVTLYVLFPVFDHQVSVTIKVTYLALTLNIRVPLHILVMLTYCMDQMVNFPFYYSLTYFITHKVAGNL